MLFRVVYAEDGREVDELDVGLDSFAIEPDGSLVIIEYDTYFYRRPRKEKYRVEWLQNPSNHSEPQSD